MGLFVLGQGCPLCPAPITAAPGQLAALAWVTQVVLCLCWAHPSSGSCLRSPLSSCSKGGGVLSCFNSLPWCIVPSLQSCHELKPFAGFLGGPHPSSPTPQPVDRAAELFHSEMLARGAVCCLPPPEKLFICLLPPPVCSFSGFFTLEGWGRVSYRDADGFW